MTKKLIEIASEIVQTQVSLTSMTAADIAASLRQVFSTLQELEKAETAGINIEVTQAAAEEVAATKLTPENSIQNDKVICLECGKEMKVLTSKHLVSHGMNQKEYRKKYGFAMRTPLAAKSLTKARSKAAKKRGLPEKLQKYIEARRQKKAATSTKAATETVAAGKQKPMLTPQNSILNDKVICLECGAEMRQLTVKHLVGHGMDQKQYKKKYGFSMRTPLAAKSVTKAQSEAAKKRGLPEKLTQLNEARRKEKTEGAAQSAEANPASKPKRTILRKKNAV
jgi:predicted transcriptional regulator